MAGRKLAHLNALVKHKLSLLLAKEVGDPRLQAVTITEVSLAKDLATANVRFSAYDPEADPAALEQVLNEAAGYLGRGLARSAEMRRTPRLQFHYDHGFDRSQEMDMLLSQLRKDAPDAS